MKNLMYEGVTQDGKSFKIYDDGTCDGDFELKCVCNQFENHINKIVVERLKKIKSFEN